MQLKHYTIPIFLPELACPFRCVYCNQFSISGKVEMTTPEMMRKTVNEHLITFKNENREVEIGFFGGNFTGIDIEIQKKYLDIAQSFVNAGQVNSIRLSTRPDYIDEKKLTFLKNYSVKTIELGAQSLNDDVLAKSGRGHSSNDVFIASELIRLNGFKLGLQMMIGLPGDSIEISLATAERIIEYGAEETRIYPLLVIKGTEIEEFYKSGNYVPLSLNEAVLWTKEIYKLFESAGVKMLRIGLHPSEDLVQGDALVAGPYHQSFKELVLTELWSELLVNLRNNNNSKDLLILVAPDQLNYAIGYSGKNRDMLREHFSKVDFATDKDLKNREFLIK
jgi:histone acetyltransferase (RNA polymerase elongator complex component)